MLDTFDENFYRSFYPDIRNNINPLKHFENHGKKESRVPNAFCLKERFNFNLNNEIVKINNETSINNIFSHTEKKITILIRSHNRKDSFEISLQSILKQKYKNYNIIVSFDNEETRNYLIEFKKKYNFNFKILKVNKQSNDVAFFDLYCNDLLLEVKNGYVFFLDDDKELMHDNVLSIISFHIEKNKILLWSYLGSDKIIFPIDCDNPKYGEIDTCMFAFDISLLKQKWSDKYGSDYYFFKDLTINNPIKSLKIVMIRVQDYECLNHYKEYNNNSSLKQYNNIFIDTERVDFKDYLNHYADLKSKFGTDEIKARNHWIKCGRKESRIVKFKNFDYEKLDKFINSYVYSETNSSLLLITSLFNEKNNNRLKEFTLSLKHNIKNPYFKKIVIFYDIDKGKNDEWIKKNTNNSKVSVIFINGRPNFHQLILYAKSISDIDYSIICNGDIIFDNTLMKLHSIMTNKNNIIALTRWDFVHEEKAIPRLRRNKIMDSSKDAWIFHSSIIPDDKMKTIELGVWNCDGFIRNIINKNKLLNYINECLNICSYHIHFMNGRSIKDDVIMC